MLMVHIVQEGMIGPCLAGKLFSYVESKRNSTQSF